MMERHGQTCTREISPEIVTAKMVLLDPDHATELFNLWMYVELDWVSDLHCAVAFKSQKDRHGSPFLGNAAPLECAATAKRPR